MRIDWLSRHLSPSPHSTRTSAHSLSIPSVLVQADERRERMLCFRLDTRRGDSLLMRLLATQSNQEQDARESHAGPLPPSACMPTTAAMHSHDASTP